MNMFLKLAMATTAASVLLIGSANAWTSGPSLSRTVNELRSHGYTVSVSGNTITATRGGQTRIITVNSSTGGVESSRSYSQNTSSNHESGHDANDDDGAFDDDGYDDNNNDDDRNGGFDDHDDDGGHDDHDDHDVHDDDD